jgi:hypothetical protein
MKKCKFLKIIDSQGGQTNPELNDEKFLDKNDVPICSLKIILPKCRPLR